MRVSGMIFDCPIETDEYPPEEVEESKGLGHCAPALKGAGAESRIKKSERQGSLGIYCLPEVSHVNTRILLLVSMAAFCGIVACSRPKGSEYFPKAGVGSRYEYLIDYKGSNGIHQAEMVERIDEEVTIQGKRYYKAVISYNGIPGLDQQTIYSRQSREGEFTIDGDSMDKPEYLSAPFPVEEGSSWTSVGHHSTTTVRVVGMETVETPHETYKNCLKLSVKRKDNSGIAEGTTYLAPGVGSVKMVYNANGVPMTFTLMKYER